MAYFNIPNVTIKGISLCVPSNVQHICDYPLFADVEKERMLPFFGLSDHHIAPETLCASDMCYEAAEKLLAEASWNKDSIDCLVVSTSAPDYIFPATACLLHNRLGLRKACAAFDVPFGCTGWVYAITILANMMTAGTIKRGLLLVGDTPTRAANEKDKTTYPFFSDSGTAVLLEYEEGAFGIRSVLGTIETGCESIISPGFGFRNPLTPESLVEKEEGPGITRRLIDTHFEGTDVFAMSTNQDPETINELLSKSNITFDSVDCFVLHQTNKFLMDRIVKKMKLPKEKFPYSLKEFGNTGGSSIPLTLVAERREELKNTKMRNVGCALGVGISYGAVCFETQKIVVPEIIEI